MEGHAVISHEVLGAYAADAAREVDGVNALVAGPRRQRGVRVSDEDGSVTVEIHVELDWGSRAGDVGSVVQRRVDEYLRRTAKLERLTVDVSVEGFAPTPR